MRTKDQQLKCLVCCLLFASIAVTGCNHLPAESYWDEFAISARTSYNETDADKSKQAEQKAQAEKKSSEVAKLALEYNKAQQLKKEVKRKPVYVSNTTLPGSNRTLAGSNRTLPGANRTLPGSSRTLPGLRRLPGRGRTLPGSNSTLPGRGRLPSSRTLRGSNSTLGSTNVLPLRRIGHLTQEAKNSGTRNWAFWRGPNYNGVSYETGLPDTWNPKGGPGSNVAWKRDDLGGRSTPIVMNGKLYVIVRAEPETPREGEKVVCVDANTGKTIWENRFNVWLSDVPDTRVGWSSVVGDPETGRVYALGVCGYFQCIDGDSGKTIWSLPLHERFGLLSTYGGRTNFPVICDDLVIISAIVIGWGNMAKPAHRFIGFDKATGQVVWFNGTRLLPYDTTYSSPTLTVMNGQKALVFGSGDGAVWAIQPRTGQPIWQYQFSRRGLNIAPLVVGDQVFTGHSEENISGTKMGSIVGIDGTKAGDVTKTGQLWKNDEMMMGKSSPIEIDGRLFCFDDRAKLHVLDIKTGEPIGRRIALGTVMRSSPLYADGKIYAITANGRWNIIKPDEKKGAVIVKKGRLPRGESSDASPIAANGSLYITTSGGIYCLRDENKKPGYNPPKTPVRVAEPPVSEDQQPAHVQVVPAEALVRPGESVEFKARLFNARGQFLREAKGEAKYTVSGNGTISNDGKLSVDKNAAHVASTVSVKVGDLEGTSRLRIVPPLPWKFDFEKLNDLPISWVGARYRHQLRTIDGSKVAVKVTTIPKGTRSRCWFGHPELSSYQIEADVKGAITNDKMPDIGLIAQGYTLDLQGASQKLQIRSWVPQLRMAKTIDFKWEPNTWYRMKFRATSDGKKAILKGKVWPKDQPEPKEWSVEAEDAIGNLKGSPGLFGNAKDAELYLDNISVTSAE